MPWTAAERSEHERVERALAIAERQFRDLFDLASDGILISDLEARFQDANVAMTRLVGYSRAELLRMTIMDLIDAEEIPRLERERAHMLASGDSLVSEWWVRRKDGTRCPLEVSAKILPDGRWQAFFRDISERKAAEHEREQLLERLRTVLEQAPVGIAMITGGPGAWRRTFNERGRALFGVSAQGASDLGALAKMLRTVDGDDLDVASLPAMKALAGERVEPIELAIQRDDGRRIPIVARAAPLLAPDGKVEGAVAAFEDVTSEKELERLRAEWNSIVAHDLRQPLNSIALYTQLLARLARDDAQMVEVIAEISTTTKRLNRMIQDLLDLSRLEARQLTLRRRPTDLPALVRVCVARVALAAPDRLLDLRVTGEIPELSIDPDRVQQALDNLLTNAVKFGAEGTPIEIAIEDGADEVAVSVGNRGAGLPPDFLPHLFQRFQRAPDGQLASVKGVGLGLYITRELVEAHGGRIAASSSPDGVTTFRFTLPRR
jgi:PAS domain S-box-containing protein